jgi:hypothetical protein
MPLATAVAMTVCFPIQVDASLSRRPIGSRHCSKDRKAEDTFGQLLWDFRFF